MNGNGSMPATPMNGSGSGYNSNSNNNHAGLKIVGVVLLGLLLIVTLICVVSFLGVAKSNAPKLAVETEMNRLLVDLEKKLETEEGMGQLLRDLQSKLEASLAEKEDLRLKVEALERDKRDWQEQDANQQQSGGGGLRGNNNNLQQQLEQLQKSHVKLQQDLQEWAQHRVREQWGPGPHRVQITVRFDPQSHVEPDRGTIVLELAPLDLLPFATYWFLEQVTHGVYDGASFHSNAAHLVQAGLEENSWSPPDLIDKFLAAGYGRLLFPEYAPAFAHEPYTVGYASGGPDWYINTRDNRVLHGPGGQGAQGETCFAKVVQGQEVVDRIHGLPVRETGGKSNNLQHNVAIVEMKLLKTER